GGGMVVAVGYALVINMMATKEVWPFFVIGFVVAAISQLTLIAIEDQITTFNDDIQGTGIVVLAGVLGGLNISGEQLKDQIILTFG
ncbi:PTS sugar transporter subunit IIC, partial [Enterococcus faecium]|uniref:PTS sugar transporter subunit IIC n=1 Tax=Enterococcus faecium TaxID=1352 RepID=UPI00292FF4DC